MADDNKKQTVTSAKDEASTAKQIKQQRLNEALKENLRRRKKPKKD